MEVENIMSQGNVQGYTPNQQINTANKRNSVQNGSSSKVVVTKPSLDPTEAQGYAEDNPFKVHESGEISLNETTVEKAISNANNFLKGSFREINYGIHEKTRQLIIKVVDTETKEVVREIPPEKALDVLANIWEMAGILVDKKG